MALLTGIIKILSSARRIQFSVFFFIGQRSSIYHRSSFDVNYVRDFQGRIGGIFRSIQVISSPSLRREVSFVYLIYWTIYESGGGKSEIDEEKERGTRKKYIYIYV